MFHLVVFLSDCVWFIMGGLDVCIAGVNFAACGSFFLLLFFFAAGLYFFSNCGVLWGLCCVGVFPYRFS